MLLAAMGSFAPAELARLVRATIRWSVRGIVSGVIGGGTAEKVYCEAATRIRSGMISSSEQVLSVLHSIVPTDEEFRGAVQAMNAPKASLTRYLLTSFERYSAGEEHPYLVSAEMENLTAQRILPAVSQSEWFGFHDEDLVGWSKRLGNFVLMRRGYKRGADRTWEEIREELQVTPVPGSARLAAVVEWSPAAIRDWQGALAEAAPKIWSREP
jgi:hypothetical protein